MFTPKVTELVRPVEPAGRDPFLDGLALSPSAVALSTPPSGPPATAGRRLS
jgi:hypothetical protein